MKKLTLSAFLFALCFLLACKKDNNLSKIPAAPNLPENVYNYQEVPGNPTATLLASNMVRDLNNHAVTLGRVLFYDRHLSQNNSTSCASCHRQNLGFADPDRFSEGLHNRLTTRNSMALSNLALQNQFFWDNRANNLRQQVLMPIENHIEMGVEDIGSLPEKLEQLDYYPPLFKAAFGNSKITKSKISSALAEFLESMVSFDSKFDAGSAMEYENFNYREKLGKELFFGKAKCSSCHDSRVFSGWGSANIGLDKVYGDNGVWEGHFKIPSLKNIEVTAPYMHDGRFETLEEVVAHYNEGIKDHPQLDWRLNSFGNGPVRLGLNEEEQKALVAFLETLTDYTFLQDPRFSNPF